jgi:hypothetical protein
MCDVNMETKSKIFKKNKSGSVNCSTIEYRHKTNFISTKNKTI